MEANKHKGEQSDHNDQLALSIYTLALAIAEQTGTTKTSYELRSAVSRLNEDFGLNK